MLDLAVKVLIAYLTGSLLGSMLVGRLRGGIDIRELGSGNAGGTNALRTQGPWFAVGVMIIDVGKGWFAAAVLPHVELLPNELRTLDAPIVTIGCAAAVVLGHVYPLWYGFRGGKGAATLIGIVFGISPTAALSVLGVWAVVLLLSGYVGLATMIAAASFPVFAVLALNSAALTWFGVATALFVVFTHRANLARMRSGTEHRATRVWLFRPR